MVTELRNDGPQRPMPEPPIPPPPEPPAFPGRFGPAFRAWLGAASVEGPVPRSVPRRFGAALAVWVVRLCLLPGALAMSLLCVAGAGVLAVEFAWGVRSGAHVSPDSILGTAVALASYTAVLGAYSCRAPVGVGPGERAVARGAAIALGLTGGAVIVVQAAEWYSA